MTEASSDQKIVRKIQRSCSSGTRMRRHYWKCKYDAEGKLISIDLHRLDLLHVPSEVGQLSNLQKLYLSDNQLKRLPFEISRLSNLQHLHLKENSDLHTPPPEIVSNGLPSIFAYLRVLQKPTVERYKAKLILVGEARMGKSSLLRALQGLPFDPLLSPTHSIDVATLQLAHPTISGEKIALHLLDFGGQQIYQATHQFFHTPLRP